MAIEEWLQNEIDETPASAGPSTARNASRLRFNSMNRVNSSAQYDDAARVGEIDDPNQKVCVARNLPVDLASR